MALNEKLTQVNKLKLELDALQPMSRKNEMNLWKKIRLDWNFNSNHIEGNTLTYGETMLLLIFDKTTGDHELREYEEMKAHDVAIHIVKEWAKDKSRDITEGDIRELNRIILVKPYWKEAVTLDGRPTRRQIKVGDYKEYPNSVRLKTGEIFQYASPLETPLKMAELIKWYRENDIQHPLVLASQLHYDFIRIHPFDDGNGRVARLLVNYVLMKNDYPPIIVKSNEKDKYLTALNKADTGDINAFHEYMADQLIWSLKLAIKAAKGESIEEADDIDKEISIFKKQAVGTKHSALHRTDNLVYEIYTEGIKDLFEQFELKHRQLYDMFKTVTISTSLNAEPKGTIEELTDAIDAIILNQPGGFVDAGETPPLMEEKDTYEYISLTIEMVEYKLNPKNSFYIASSLDIELKPYVYTVSHYANVLLEKFYDEIITPDERIKILSKCMKTVLEDIKTQAKQ